MIKNKTKNTLVSSSLSYKKGLGKILGLIGKKNQKTAIFITRFGIHTFFLKFPIDVVILDKNKKIVFLKENLKPNRIFVWNPMFSIVVELPSGSVRKSKTQIGDILEYSL